MRSSPTPDETFVLWYELGNLYEGAANDARRAFEWDALDRTGRPIVDT